jgi:hypothetical protein
MKKQTISRLAAGSLLIVLGIASLSCGFMYHINEYYSYMPSGEITLSELREFDAYALKDTFGHTADKYIATGYFLKVQKQGTNKKVPYYFTKYPDGVEGDKDIGDRIKHLHSLLADSSHVFGVGDSVWLTIYYDYREYYEKRVKRNESNWFYSSSYTTQVFKINDESLIELKRQKDLLFKAYPSPAKTEVNVRVDVSSSSPGTVALLNARGQVLEENERNDITVTSQIKLEPYPSGTYYVQVTFKGENFIKKIIKE